MSTEADLKKAVMDALIKNKKNGRPKGIPKHPQTGSLKNVSSNRKDKKNKVTPLKEELKALLKEEVLSEDRFRKIVNKIWDLAISDKSVNCLGAAKLWIDIYNSHVSRQIVLTVNTFEDIETAAQRVMDEVGAGRLPITQGKELMYMLHIRKTFREATLTPGVEKILEEEINTRTIRR